MVYNMKSLSFFFCVWMDEWMDGCFFLKKKKRKRGEESEQDERTVRPAPDSEKSMPALARA